MLGRLGRQAPPVVQPPLLPPPWADTSEPREWQAIANHSAQCLQEALSRYPRVVLVKDTELEGPLYLNKAEAESSGATLTELQRRCSAADVVILHDDLDALVVAATTPVVQSMRAHLEKIGFPDAISGPRRVDSMTPKEQAWLFHKTSKKACPNHGSSHTGVTSDFGIHDGQVSIKM